MEHSDVRKFISYTLKVSLLNIMYLNVFRSQKDTIIFSAVAVKTKQNKRVNTTGRMIHTILRTYAIERRYTLESTHYSYGNAYSHTLPY